MSRTLKLLLAFAAGVVFARYILPRLIIVADAAPGSLVAGEKAA